MTTITEEVARQILLAFDDVSCSFGIDTDLENFCHQLFNDFPNLRSDSILSDFADYLDEMKENDERKTNSEDF